MENVKNILIKESCSIKEALNTINKGAKKIVIVVDESNKLIGVITDGDIRRWILNGGNLSSSLKNVCNYEPKYISEGYNVKDVKRIMLDYSIEIIPVVNNEKQVIDIVEWEDLFRKEKIKTYNQLNLPVVIMAGGKGTRLDPFTRILPKPLIPIGDKPIMEIIMDEFAKYGMKHFIISINHKGKMIKAYFEDNISNYTFSYINEDKPLGTVGALKYLEGKFDIPFFVTNCDIIIKEDYTKIYNFHKKEGHALTLVASIQNHVIPYGVCEIEKGGELKSFREKPQFDFLVNTGMYILNPEVLKYIPENQFYHMTYLINKLQNTGFKIGVYPISKKDWIDVGHWEEYKQLVEKLE